MSLALAALATLRVNLREIAISQAIGTLFSRISSGHGASFAFLISSITDEISSFASVMPFITIWMSMAGMPGWRALWQ